MSLFDRFQAACATQDPVERVAALESLQGPVANIHSSNESMEEIGSHVIPFLGLEHLLATAYTELPFSQKQLTERVAQLQRACALWESFWNRLDRLEIVEKEEREQWEALLERHDSRQVVNISRDVKIARFQALRHAQNEYARLQSLQQRRARLCIAETETLDGHDDESLERTMHLTVLEKIYKPQALEGWTETLREMDLLEGMLAQHHPEQEQRVHDHRQPASNSRQQQPKQGLQVTHITQNSQTGQLNVAREEIRANVLRAGWNQPTMSLQELGERELAQALQREESQKQSEAASKDAPRRYEYVVRDGLEDDMELVDASAPIDRAWDDFKDENPKGSGNKRGDVGDRNF
jgi:immunoglobulin-binding protein 1